MSGRSTDKQRAATYRQLLHSVLLRLFGEGAAVILSVVLLGMLLVWSRAELRLIAEILTGLLLVRLVISSSGRPTPLTENQRRPGHVGQVLGTEFKVGGALLALVYLLDWPVDRTAMIGFLILSPALRLAAFFMARAGLRQLFRATRVPFGRSVKTVVIVGTGPQAKGLADKILEATEGGLSIRGFLDYHRRGLWRYRDLPLIGHPDTLASLAVEGQLDAVLVAVDPDDLARTRPLLRTAQQVGVTVAVLADSIGPETAVATAERLCGHWALTYRSGPPKHFSRQLKSILDRLGGLVGLLVAMPLIVVTALLIKLDSKGPVLFRQIRLGRNGRPFTLFKFRTMSRDAERRKKDLLACNELSGPAFKIRDDPRVTYMGRFLRKYSIDEIPQFINVLLGDMSLVGPRPPLPSEVAQYQSWQRRRLSVKPGLTCIWQVSGRNKIEFEEWMRLDLKYIDRWSLWQDAKLLAKTIPAVVRGEGAS